MPRRPSVITESSSREVEEAKSAPTKEDETGAVDGSRPAHLSMDERIALAHALIRSAEVEIVGARAEEGNGMWFRLSIDDEELAIVVSNVRVVEGNLESITSKPTNLQKRYNRFKRPEDFSVEELQERNLPLYWNEQWLRGELARLGTYAEIARVHGFNSGITIAAYAKRKFGISVQDDYDRRRQAVYHDHDAGNYTQLELANKYDVGVATVYRWLQERRTEETTAERRGQGPIQAPANPS